MSELIVKKFTGSDIKPWVPDLAQLRIEVFREFPYLYDGSLEYEENYLSTYTDSPDSIAVIVFDQNHVVGASTAIPMKDEDDEFIQPFITQSINPKEVFYCGESVLKKEFRGRGIYSELFRRREEHAIKLGGFRYCSFCAVVRNKDHPLRPESYTPLDDIWNRYGYKKHPELHTTYRWKDIDQDRETAKKMVFWVKEL